MKHKLKTVWGMMRTYKNWVRLILYKMKILPGATTVKIRSGAKFYIRNKMDQDSDLYIINESYLYGIHDDILPYIKNAKIGIDIGAHIGTFTVFAAQNSSAKIYAVEPEDDNLELLKKHIALNGFTDRIIPVEGIVAKESGEREFYVAKNRGLSSLFKDHPGKYGGTGISSVKKVKSFSMKDLFETYHIDFCDFMKMDTEGAEYEIFYDLPREMYDRIGVMGIEIGGESDRDALVEHIRDMGFTVTRPRPEFNEYFCVNNRLLKML
ncbi:MAG: FkbM family methyltransferase [bacterium]|nr:FkbM family methyltransferase [bacterium]